MPWNEDNDDEMNDREGVENPSRQPSLPQPQDNSQHRSGRSANTQQSPIPR